MSVYGRDRFGYLVGKYGGMILSLTALVVLDRFVSDVLTGLKAFDATLLRELDVRALGLDYETELLVRLTQRHERIMEVPVSFQGRTRAEGKKTRVIDGVWALARLVRTRS
jgi:hypothetical protein